jgi:hypothetical protein
VPALGNKDIGWFDVAVDNAFPVRRIEPVGNLNGQIENGIYFDGRPAMRCLRVTPSRNSMAMNASPCWSSISWMVQILG